LPLQVSGIEWYYVNISKRFIDTACQALPLRCFIFIKCLQCHQIFPFLLEIISTSVPSHNKHNFSIFSCPSSCYPSSKHAFAANALSKFTHISLEIAQIKKNIKQFGSFSSMVVMFCPHVCLIIVAVLWLSLFLFTLICPILLLCSACTYIYIYIYIYNWTELMLLLFLLLLSSSSSLAVAAAGQKWRWWN
jgi:hypothetical protein